MPRVHTTAIRHFSLNQWVKYNLVDNLPTHSSPNIFSLNTTVKLLILRVTKNEEVWKNEYVSQKTERNKSFSMRGKWISREGARYKNIRKGGGVEGYEILRVLKTKSFHWSNNLRKPPFPSSPPPSGPPCSNSCLTEKRDDDKTDLHLDRGKGVKDRWVLKPILILFSFTAKKGKCPIILLVENIHCNTFVFYKHFVYIALWSQSFCFSLASKIVFSGQAD